MLRQPTRPSHPARLAVFAVALLCVVAACSGPRGEPAPSVTVGVETTGTTAASATATSQVTIDVREPDTEVAAGSIRLVPREPASNATPLTLVPINAADTISYPVALKALPGSDDLLVVERWGRLRLMAADGSVSQPIVDLTASVLGEENAGMLGLAVHPDFASNGLVYLHHLTRDGFDRVVEYQLRDLVGEERRTLVEVVPGSATHQGGALHFGPDGYLYVGFGDGGNGAVAGDTADLRGAIVRIDVDGGSEPTVWISGVRNPYQFWFDPTAGRIIVPDPGAATVEEISVVPLSMNFADLGWPVKEGIACRTTDHRIATSGCGTADLFDPVLVYFHGPECAIIGGPAYRGSRIVALDGQVLFADFCNRWIRSAAIEGGELLGTAMWAPEDPTELDPIVAFATDDDGEVYVLTGPRGLIYRIEPAD